MKRSDFEKYPNVAAAINRQLAKQNQQTQKPKAEKSRYDTPILRTSFIAYGIPEPVFEYRFCESRRWRMDIAWPSQKVFVEVQGGIWTQGRHSRGAGMLKDFEKFNEAAAMGWRILLCEPNQLLSEDFLCTIKRVLK